MFSDRDICLWWNLPGNRRPTRSPKSRPQSFNTAVGCLSKKCSVIGTFLMVESSRERGSNKKTQKEAPKLQDWGWLSLKEMFSDRDIPYGGIYPGTEFQQEAPKRRPQSFKTGVGCPSKKCSVIGSCLMVESTRGIGFQQEAPKVGPEASTPGLVVFQRNVQ